LRRIAPPGATGGNGCVLVVDDDLSTLDFVKNTLQAEGYHAKTVRNGREAIPLLSTTRFDALILNLLTPEADSFDLLHRVKSEPRWRHIPIFVLTGQKISSHDLRVLRQEREFWNEKSRSWKDDLLRQLEHTVKSD